MENFEIEWKTFKKSGSIEDYLSMKKREHDYKSYIEEYSEEETFDEE